MELHEWYSMKDINILQLSVFIPVIKIYQKACIAL